MQSTRQAVWTLALGLALGAAVPGSPALALEYKDTPAARQPAADPYVLLDAAKLTLADGRLEDAAVQLAAIPLGKAEPFVDEEIIIQRLLISGAFLTADSYVASQVIAAGEGSGAYCNWLRGEAQKHAAEFSALSQQYLKLTEGGYWCTFIRFRLPRVTEEHLQDVQLYTDPQILGPAAKNWEEGRDTLGRGVALSQARVALVLAAATHYDLKEASSTILGVSRRLNAGVPVHPARLLDWLAQTAAQHAVPSTELAAAEAALDQRLLALCAQQPGGYPARVLARQKLVASNLRQSAAPPPARPAPPALSGPEGSAAAQDSGQTAGSLPPPETEQLSAPPAAAEDAEPQTPESSEAPEESQPADAESAEPSEPAEGAAQDEPAKEEESGADNKDGKQEKKRPHARPIPRRPRSQEGDEPGASNTGDTNAS